jgi:hypothetical protein
MTRDEATAAEVREPELPSFDSLPYPIALTAQRMAAEIRSGDKLFSALSRLKDCFEATVKYLGFALLTDYFAGPARTAEHSESLAENMIMPSLGNWNTILTNLSEWLTNAGGNMGRRIASFFKEPKGRSLKLQPTDLGRRCSEFVKYRNDTLGQGVTLQDTACRAGLEAWMPLIQELLGAVATLQDWRLLLVNDRDKCQVWMGPKLPTATEPGEFRLEQIGHFVLRGPVAAETQGTPPPQASDRFNQRHETPPMTG